jgi:hypothetical protein
MRVGVVDFMAIYGLVIFSLKKALGFPCRSKFRLSVKLGSVLPKGSPLLL